jgi:hypothetical protein
MPVLAVWSESALYVSSKETAKKSRNLAADGRCVITTDAGNLHLRRSCLAGSFQLSSWSFLLRRAINVRRCVPIGASSRPIRLAAGGAAPTRGVGVDGQEVADLGDAFDVGGYLLYRALLVVGVDLAPDLGHPVVDLDVEAEHVGGARVLADPRPDALLELLLEMRVAPLPQTSDQCADREAEEGEEPVLQPPSTEGRADRELPEKLDPDELRDEFGGQSPVAG